MDYEELIKYLQDRHFYPAKEVQVSKKTEKVVGLRVEAAPIMMESKMQRLEEILAGQPVSIQKMPNDSYILITIKKSTKK